jgi:hypothetical protein
MSERSCVGQRRTAIYGKCPEALAGKSNKDPAPVADTKAYVPVNEQKEDRLFMLIFSSGMIKLLHMIMMRHAEERNLQSMMNAVQYMINLVVVQDFNSSKI